MSAEPVMCPKCSTETWTRNRFWVRCRYCDLIFRPAVDAVKSSAAQDRHEPPLCESKNCPNRAIGLVTDRNGVQWAACEKHAKDVLGDG